MSPDDLGRWLRIRDEVSWHGVADPRPGATGEVVGVRDGVEHLIRTVEHDRDPERARRLLRALAEVRSDVSDGRALDFAVLRRWQGHVLGTEPPAFRTRPAFAKGGRERYGLDSGTPRRFEECLRQAGDADVPLPGRAARAYLDVCFFHPFADGNARAALLALTFVLARSGVVLDQAGPIRMLSRGVSAEAAPALARLVAVLIGATRDRATRPSPRR